MALIHHIMIKETLTINKHELDGSSAWGNGGHGHCRHCGLALETDLGWCSWTGVKCIDRRITKEIDLPHNIRSYANFCGYIWSNEDSLFIKPYLKDRMTLSEMTELVDSLALKH